MNLLRNQEKALGGKFTSVVYCTLPGSFGLLSDTLNALKKIVPDVIVFEGIYSAYDLRNPSDSLIIIDDQYQDLAKSKGEEDF